MTESSERGNPYTLKKPGLTKMKGTMDVSLGGNGQSQKWYWASLVVTHKNLFSFLSKSRLCFLASRLGIGLKPIFTKIT